MIPCESTEENRPTGSRIVTWLVRPHVWFNCSSRTWLSPCCSFNEQFYHISCCFSHSDKFALFCTVQTEECCSVTKSQTTSWTNHLAKHVCLENGSCGRIGCTFKVWSSPAFWRRQKKNKQKKHIGVEIWSHCDIDIKIWKTRNQMKGCGNLFLHLPTKKMKSVDKIQPVTALATSNLSCRINIADGSDYKADVFVLITSVLNRRLWSKLYWYKCLFTINSQILMELTGRNTKNHTAGAIQSVVLPRHLNYDIKLPNLGLCLPLSSLYG